MRTTGVSSRHDGTEPPPGAPAAARGRLSLLVALVLFLGVVGVGAWAANHYRPARSAEGPATGHVRGRRHATGKKSSGASTRRV